MLKLLASIFCGILFLWPNNTLLGQPDFYSTYSFTEADTLRGMLRPERTCYDVHFYYLDLVVDPIEKAIQGKVEMHYQIKENFNTLQIDLFKNMTIDQIQWEGKSLKYKRLHDAVFVNFPNTQKQGNRGFITIKYHGNPTIAKMPPWDGGFVWSKDDQGKDWVAVACEGDGASLWWPNKDHLSDEPDSVRIRCEVPNPLMCVANGNLIRTEKKDESTVYDWFVSYPINNYNVTLNIAEYAHFSDQYINKEKKVLALDYYVLKNNLEKAKVHFQQVHGVLESFEHYFGEYPFWEDGFALVETPYLGMEHQSAIAYGNKYMRGYLGNLPPGFDFDYIIVHETGHEYWGNSISCNDLCEMWIHESFTTYMESLYVEYHHGYKEAIRYMLNNRFLIGNKEPILGPKDVNWENWKESDHYYKGAWILHSLRHAIQNDELWFDLLKSFHEKNKLSNITTEDWIQHVNICTGKDYHAFFEQYLSYPSIPTLTYKIKKKRNKLTFCYRWEADVKAFDMPMKIGVDEKYQTIYPTAEWQSIDLGKIEEDQLRLATELFYINTRMEN